MAFFPCDEGPHRNPKRNNNVYVGIVGNEPEATRYSLRLCDEHFAFIENNLSEIEVDPNDPAGSWLDDLAQCFACHQPLGEISRQLFVTAYPTKNERKDYWARIHDACTVPAPLKKPSRARA
jgi:hypothetical protein